MVSRDVVFEEDQKWKWLQTEKETNDNLSMINFGFREVGEEDTPRVVEEVNNEEEGLDTNGRQEEALVALRRSSRTIVKPAYLDDYELLCEEDEMYETLCEIECEHLLMLVNEEPWN